jgi:hypothetical protein
MPLGVAYLGVLGKEGGELKSGYGTRNEKGRRPNNVSSIAKTETPKSDIFPINSRTGGSLDEAQRNPGRGG